jgi:serine/threonine protein kinase
MLAEIARGQLASIHLAEETDEDGTTRRSAFKRVRPELAAIPGWSELLADEALLLSAIDHPNVVACRDAGRDGGTYVVLQHVEGDSLEGLLARCEIWRWPRLVAAVIADALRGLAATHAACTPDGVPLHIVHQAPRARHILVGVDGHARLADFTQARVQNLALGSRRMERLRGALVAPELLDDPENVDLRADLFVLGGTLWESLTGEKLSESSDEHSSGRGERVRRPSTIGLRPPKEFDEVCLRALATSPQHRFGSAQEMLSALLAAAERAGGVAAASEVSHWVMATDALSQAAAQDVSASVPDAASRTLPGAYGLQMESTPDAAPDSAAPSPKRQTASWPSPVPQPELAEPIRVRPRSARATLQGFAVIPIRELDGSQAPTTSTHEPVLQDRPGRDDDDDAARARVETQPVSFDDTTGASRVRSSPGDGPTSTNVAAPADGSSLFPHLAGWAATLSLLAGVLLVGDMAMASVLPWPEVRLTREHDAQDVALLAPPPREAPPAELTSQPTESVKVAAPQAAIEVPPEAIPSAPAATVRKPLARGPSAAPAAPAAPKPLLAPSSITPAPRATPPETPAGAQEPLPDNPY